MTTIAYDGRYIAADGRESMGSVICNDKADKFYVRDIGIFILCGRVSDCIQFANEFYEEKEASNKKGECGGFLFAGRNTWLVFMDEDSKLYHKNRISSGMWADGSGRDWAIAAMDHGKSAIDAVKYAITRDKGSGGLIRCLDTHTGKFIKVKQ